jgi:hypothetical protein
MSRQSLDAFRRKVLVEWPKQQRDGGKAALIRAAHAGHDKIMAEQTARSGIAPDWNAYANHPGNTNLESVEIPGPIVYRYRYLREVVEVTLEALQRASPVLSGAYVSSHTIFLNGAAVDALPEELTDGDEIFIANTVPYARRLEVGKTESGRAFVIQVEPNIYERVYDQMKDQFHNVAKLSMDYVDMSGAYRLKYNQVARHFERGRWRHEHHQRRDRMAGSAVTAPAIFISSLR